MPISLHECTVASFDTTLGALEQVLAKGRAYCEESDIALDDVVGTRLRDDMLPFHFQVVSAWHHSVGALNGVKAGEFAPPPKIERDYAGLQALLGEAREGLKAFTVDIVEGYIGADVVFKIGENEIPFVAQDFLLSFSKPNFYFHAATAYDILRIQGVALGKRDFIGAMKTKA
jgi:hypothetical protein